MDLLAIAACVLVLLPLIYAVPFEPLRVALGVLLVLFFPGYMFLAALFPRRENLDGVERIALSLGLSVALVPLLGLALNFTPWGIRLTPIVLTLSLWTLALGVAAWFQRRRVAPEERFELRWGSLTAWFRRRPRPLDLAVGAVLGLSLLAVVGVIAWRIQNPPPGETFTEFYVLGARGTLQEYPTALRLGEAQEYNLGIVNRERGVRTYTIRAVLASASVGSVGPLTLKDGERWEGKVQVTPTAPGDQLKLEFLLYRGDKAESYRKLHLFVKVTAP